MKIDVECLVPSPEKPFRKPFASRKDKTQGTRPRILEVWSYDWPDTNFSGDRTGAAQKKMRPGSKNHPPAACRPSKENRRLSSDIFRSTRNNGSSSKMATATQISLPLPSLPEGWSHEKDFKLISKIGPSHATQRTIEPVGPHFLAHARRARHKRTFSEDDRIQAQERAKKVEEDNESDISEPEDPMMLQRDAKDWKVCGYDLSLFQSMSARDANSWQLVPRPL